MRNPRLARQVAFIVLGASLSLQGLSAEFPGRKAPLMSRREALGQLGALAGVIPLAAEEESKAGVDLKARPKQREALTEMERDRLEPQVLPSLVRDIDAKIVKDKLHYPSQFLYLFAEEGPGKRAQDSHTFASFVSVDEKGKQQWNSISWLPKAYAQDQSLRVFKTYLGAAREKIFGRMFDPEPGKNYGRLDQTLTWGLKSKKTVSVWGPYLITPELFALGKERIRHLREDGVKYIANDSDTRASGEAINCMHAVSDLEGPIAPSFRDQFDYGRWGVEGTLHVLDLYLEHGKSWIVDDVNPRQYQRFEAKED